MNTQGGKRDERVVMAIGAHPDDIEFMMAGTLLLLKARGWKLHVMHLGDGVCGSMTRRRNEIRSIRRREAERAAAELGATYHPSIAEDIGILYDRLSLARLAAVIRAARPDLLLVPALDDYMEDHVTTSRLAVTAAFVRAMPNYVTEPVSAPIDNDVVIYHALPHGLRDPLRRRVRPGLYVDIHTVMSRKRRALEAHESQREWLDASQGPGSYVEAMVRMARRVGRMSQRFEYAEGWRRHLHLGFSLRDRDLLAEAIPEYVLLDEVYEAELDPFGGGSGR